MSNRHPERAKLRAERLEARRQQIIDVARERAESGGWGSVTTRGLADAIGYSQPVLYGHFPGGKDEIQTAVALAGFRELALVGREARAGKEGVAAAFAVGDAYVRFATEHRAVFEAMFTLPIGATFASDNTEDELRDGFASLVDVVGDSHGRVETTAEVFWAALHGLAALEQTGRMPPEMRAERLMTLARFVTGSSD